MAVNSFEKQLGVEFRRTLRTRYGIDLFDPHHARKVLMAFGRGFGQLPDDPKDLSDNQKDFWIKRGGTDREGRSSRFGWRCLPGWFRGKPWTTETLRKSAARRA